MVDPRADYKQRRIDGTTGQLMVLTVAVLISPLVVAALAIYCLIGMLLHVVVWCWWCPRGRDMLFVYSNSPIWQEYVQQQLLPPLETRAVVLNWSERRNWRPSLAVWAFRYFGGSRAYNPIAIVFRPLRRTRTFRFYEPFHDLKHGKPERVERMTSELFAAIGEGAQTGSR